MSRTELPRVARVGTEVMPGSAAGPDWRYGCSGPVEIAWDGRAVDIGGVKARALFARLLIDRQIIVSVDRLVDSLWGDHDGPGAEIALRSTISRLRKRLRDAGAPEELIVTRAPGYVLDVPAECTDAFRLEQLVAEGTAAAGPAPAERCVRLLAEAEGLWRGPAYSEVRDEPFARAEARRLEELLLAATETRIDAELTLGRHEAVTGELETLTSAHPMRERLWSQRMLALYRSGRQAEALRVFQDLRQHSGGRAGHRAGARRDLDGARRPRAGPRARLPGPARGADAASAVADSAAPSPRPGLPGPGAGVLSGRAAGRPGPGDRACARLVGVGGPGRRAAAPRRRRRRHRQDAPGGRAGPRRRGARARWCSGAAATKIRWRPSSPSPRRSGAYFQSLSADRISRMPDWQLSELSRLVLRLREYAPGSRTRAAIRRASGSASSRR